MAKGAGKASKTAVAEETVLENPARYTEYADKKATPLQDFFGPWIKQQTGYDPNAAESQEQAFLDGVRLAVFLRMEFQASPENKARRAQLAEAGAEAKAAREAKAAEREAGKEAREAEKVRKAEEREAAKVAKAEAAEKAKADKAAAAEAAKAAKATETAEKPAKATKAAPAKAAATPPVEEPAAAAPKPRAKGKAGKAQAAF